MTVVWPLLAAGVLAAAIVLIGARRRGRSSRSPRALDSTEVYLYRLTGPAATPERRIGIVTGDLRRVRCADVWVNSENTMMQMARFEEFSVSSIIRYEGAVRDDLGRVTDDGVAKELARRLAGRGPVSPATAITTGPGELRHSGVRHLVHVAAVQGEPGAGFRQVREVGRCVTNVLSEVDGLGEHPTARRVLFPLLGVGQGGGELEPTINAMVNAAADYFTAHPATRVGTVFLLAYTDAELTTCRRVLAGNARVRPMAAAPDPAEIATPSAGAALAHAGQPAEPPASGGRRLQMGFVVDVVGYSRRPALAQETVQKRLARLVESVLADTGLELGDLDHQWAGDGVTVFLPSESDPTTMVPGLVASMSVRLASDNERHTDRIRLRMALGVGITAPGAAGFAGPMIIEINRLVDSAPLRAAMDGRPQADLGVLLSDRLHGHIVEPGYPVDLADELRAVHVSVKEFDQRAWLWVPGSDSTAEAGQ